MSDAEEPAPSAVDALRDSAVLSVLFDVAESVYTPGINAGVVKMMAFLLFVLFTTNVGLIAVFGLSVHLAVLLFLTLALTALMAWWVLSAGRGKRRGGERGRGERAREKNDRGRKRKREFSVVVLSRERQ